MEETRNSLLPSTFDLEDGPHLGGPGLGVGEGLRGPASGLGGDKHSNPFLSFMVESDSITP